MKLQHLSVRRFRGINELEWNVGGKASCLVGPSDATKTTVLDAIELVLGPRWNIAVDDGDFYNTVHDDGPIEITATITDIPDELLDERKFGRHVRGWTGSIINDEPTDDDTPALSIRLSIDSSLEPSWDVITDRLDPVKIGGGDRDRLGLGRAGTYVDRHLSWGRGSALSRISGSIDAQGEFHAAARALRTSIPATALDPFRTAATNVASVASAHGVAPSRGYEPALDRGAISFAGGSISLHDGPIPVQRAGLGTRRLVTVAMQVSNAPNPGIVLIDEVEHGLEPHRIRTLLNKLVSDVNSGSSQIIITTHSPVVVEELRAEHICVVRSSGGMTTITRASEELQDTVRGASQALVSRKILVCEGRTEIGILRALDEHRRANAGISMSLTGCCPCDGRGHSAPRTALRLADLGYDVCLFVDADQDLSVDGKDLTAAGVRVVQWPDSYATEDAVMKDLPWPAVQALMVEVADRRGDVEPIWTSVNAKLDAGEVDEDLMGWAESAPLRVAIAAAAKSKSQQWFKDIEGGELLGASIMTNLGSIGGTDTAMRIEQLTGWIDA